VLRSRDDPGYSTRNPGVGYILSAGRADVKQLRELNL
jgi:hypothetical protein